MAGSGQDKADVSATWLSQCRQTLAQGRSDQPTPDALVDQTVQVPRRSTFAATPDTVEPPPATTSPVEILEQALVHTHDKADLRIELANLAARLEASETAVETLEATVGHMREEKARLTDALQALIAADQLSTVDD